MKFIRPQGILTQNFGGNSNPYYLDNGLSGHTGYDFYNGYNKPVFSTCGGKVYKILNKNNPDLSKFRSVFTLSEENDLIHEVCYGHFKDIWVGEGDEITELQPIGTEGNTGDVYYQGLPVSIEERERGSTRGTHLHIQDRWCKRTSTLQEGKYYLTYNDGIYNDNGSYYEILYYNNGYHGCEPMNFTEPTIMEKFILFIKAVLNIIKQL